MNHKKKRLLKIEEAVCEEEGLTLEDVELILSVLPTEYAYRVRKKLCEMPDEEDDGLDKHQPTKLRGKQKFRSGLHGKTLEFVLNILSPECAEKLRAKVAQR